MRNGGREGKVVEGNKELEVERSESESRKQRKAGRRCNGARHMPPGVEQREKWDA